MTLSIIFAFTAATGWIYAAYLSAENDKLKNRLHQASRNDNRDPKTGRFVRAA